MMGNENAWRWSTRPPRGTTFVVSTKKELPDLASSSVPMPAWIVMRAAVSLSRFTSNG